MEPSNYVNIPDKPRYISFSSLEHGSKNAEGKQALNRWSSTLTKGTVMWSTFDFESEAYHDSLGHDFPGAQAMLYAAGVPNREAMKSSPHVGISTVWWEGNPCKYGKSSMNLGDPY
jgi:dihydroxy-acid dehydratase